jgi:hypothetical protein
MLFDSIAYLGFTIAVAATMRPPCGHHDRSLATDCAEARPHQK